MSKSVADRVSQAAYRVAKEEGLTKPDRKRRAAAVRREWHGCSPELRAAIENALYVERRRGAEAGDSPPNTSRGQGMVPDPTKDADPTRATRERKVTV